MTTSESIALAGAIFTGLSTLFAGCTVLFAIFVYRRNRDKETFSDFRLSLVDLKHTVSSIDNYLSEPYFSDLGHRIGMRIVAMSSSAKTTDELIEFLQSKENHDYVAQAIHLGRLDCTSLNEAKELENSLRRMPFRYRELFPVAFGIIMRLTFYILRTSEMARSPQLFDRVLGDPDAIKEMLVPELKKKASYERAQVDVEMFVAAVPLGLIRVGQPSFDHAERLLTILADRYSLMTDSELRRQSKLERGCRAKLEAIDCPTMAEDAFAYFNLIRSLFSHAAWDEIVKQKTKLITQAHEQDGDDDT